MSAIIEPTTSNPPQAGDMVWIPGGTFRMGSDHHYPEEAPAPPRARRRILDRSHARHQPPVPPFRRGDRLRDLRRDRARPEGLSRRAAAHAARPARWCSRRRGGRSICATSRTGGTFSSAPTGAGRTGRGSSIDGHGRPSGRARRVRRCRGVRRMGGQGAADGSRVGVRGARRARRRGLRVGRRVHARRAPHGQHLAGRFPEREPAEPTATSARRP